MAPSKQLLFLSEDSEAAACLEVLRRLIATDDRALPHITLRYSSKPLRESAEVLYQDLSVSDLVLDKVTSFDDVDGNTGGVRTVVIFCDSEQLEHVSYRPDHPQSVFHLTLYDGVRSEFAALVLDHIRRFDWNLRLPMNFARFQSSESALAASTVKLRSGGWFTDMAWQIYETALADFGLRGSLTDLAEDERLALALLVCRRLHRADGVKRNELVPARDYQLLLEDRELGQAAFWSEREIRSLSPGPPREREQVTKGSTYITPPELTLDVVDETLKWVNPDDLVDFGDPAIGAGIFYAALRHRVGDDAINSAQGVEIDSFSADRTLHRWRRTKLNVIVGDFLEQTPAPVWNLVLANPPYRRSQLLGAEVEPLRRRIEDDLGIQVSARSDLYLYFVLRAHRWMQPGAVAAWVIPAEFQVTEYGQSLREYFATRVELLRMHTYDSSEPQFDNALITTSVLILRNQQPSADHRVVVSEGGDLASPERTLDLESRELARTPRWSFASLRNDGAGSRRLGDYFDIKRGIATGANSLFVLTSADVDRLEVDRAWLRPLFPRARDIELSELPGDGDVDSRAAADNWLIDTTLSIPDIQKRSPRFAEYLRSIEAKASESALVRRRDPFYRQDDRPAPEIAFVYMAKASGDARRRFILNGARASILNNYLGLYAKPHVRQQLDLDPQLIRRIHRSLVAIGPDELLRQGRLYGKSLLKLEPSEVARLALLDDAVWESIDGQ